MSLKKVYFNKIDELISKLKSLKRDYNRNEKNKCDDECYTEFAWLELCIAERFIDKSYVHLKYSRDAYDEFKKKLRKWKKELKNEKT